MEVTGRLENWYRIGSIIIGDIHDDIYSRWVDGTSIHTSRVESIGSEYVVTLNSKYLLGKPYSSASVGGNDV